MFKAENGGRVGIPHVAIVLTDGNSNKPADTAVEALRARLQGVHIFAIGVGDIDEGELKALSSQPPEKHVFKVHSYSSLVSIKELLAIEACRGIIRMDFVGLSSEQITGFIGLLARAGPWH